MSYVHRLLVNSDAPIRIVFSNSGPSWWGANSYNGQGRLVGGRSSFDRSKEPYKCEYEIYSSKQLDSNQLLSPGTWHEVLGDGAWASMTFTGTRVNLTGTICRTGYQTTVDFYLDGQYATRFENIPADRTLPIGVSPDNPSASSDIYLLYTMANFDNLSPAEHTLKAVSVGADSLFVVDFIAYEPSAAAPVSSNPVSSSSASSLGTPSTTGSTNTGSTSGASSIVSTSLSASSSPSSQSVQSTSSAGIGDSQSIAAAMDVPALDSHILYWPPGAWSPYSDARRATSCLEGTMSSSTVGSYLAYDFTGEFIAKLFCI